MKRILKNSLKKIGVQIKRYPDLYLKRRMLLMSKLGIDTVFDIGANTGQYALELRELGYMNRIISFEPLRNAFEELYNNSLRFKNWQVCNYALGDENCTSSINIANNSYSSSILEMLPSHVESAPDSKYIDKEEIEIKRLDNVFSSFCRNDYSVMLKIDTQGYEKNVIDGATNILNRISLIQLEMSIIPLYSEEMLFTEMINHLDKIGFQLVSLEDGFSDASTGQLLQVDGLFVNKQSLKKNKL